jgi:large subunit ribosomal protein L30
MADMIKITLTGRYAGTPDGQRRTLQVLGLKRRHQTVEHADSVSLRGQIAKVAHLVAVEGLVQGK